MRRCWSSTQKLPQIWLQLVPHDIEFITILIVYDGFCSLCYSTNFFENSCLACISPSYDKDAKVGASVSLLEHCEGCCINVLFLSGCATHFGLLDANYLQSRPCWRSARGVWMDNMNGCLSGSRDGAQGGMVCKVSGGRLRREMVRRASSY